MKPQLKVVELPLPRRRSSTLLAFDAEQAGYKVEESSGGVVIKNPGGRTVKVIVGEVTERLIDDALAHAYRGSRL